MLRSFSIAVLSYIFASVVGDPVGNAGLVQEHVLLQRRGVVQSHAHHELRMRETGSLPSIEIISRQLHVDGHPLHLKGVNWNPVPKGAVTPFGLDYAGYVEQDGELMRVAGINVLRTYEPLTDRSVLDILWSKGIWVMNTVYVWGGADLNTAAAAVDAVKDHPAILMWCVGNEWNYNGLYNGLSFDASLARVRDVTRLIKQHDSSRPVSTVYGEVPTVEVLDQLSDVDIWGLNAYRGIGFGDLFDVWAARSSKPMYLGEYGADAYNALIDHEDQQAQADATRVLTETIVAHSAVIDGGICLGGVIFELADEWYKDGNGRSDVHDVGGVAPGGGPHPDSTFNEEWWGLVDIDRNPRMAYTAYRDVLVPSGKGPSPKPSPTPTPTLPTPTPEPLQVCPETPAQLTAWSCPQEDLGVELLSDPNFGTEGDAGAGWTPYVYETSDASFAFGSPGVIVGLSSDGDDTAWHVQLTQSIELDRLSEASYELCVQSVASAPSSVLVFAVDGGEARGYAVAGGGQRANMALAIGTLETRCFRFILEPQGDKYEGRVALELGATVGSLAICQASLRRCGKGHDPTPFPTPVPTPLPTATDTPVPTAAPTPSTQMPTPIPTARPTPSPTADLTAHFSLDPCGTASPWQFDRQIRSAEGFAFQGKMIRREHLPNLCGHCATRCWLQMSGDCVGVVWEQESESSGQCTYFSRIDAVVSVSGHNMAVTTASHALGMQRFPESNLVPS